MKLIYQTEFKAKVKKEKDLYPILKNKVFSKSIKIYSTVFKGFPDFIVVSFRAPFSSHLPAGFYEVKFVQKYPQNPISLLSPYQKKAFEFLSEAFQCYLAVGSALDEDNIQVQFWAFQ